MDLSDRGLAHLCGSEAIVTRRYLDSVKVWTVGVGHTKSAGAPDPATITTDQPVAYLLEIFARDVKKFVAGVNAAVTVAVTQYEFDALVSFHFNAGAIARASLTKMLNAGDRAGAAAAFMSWSKPPEIIDRRKNEMILFRDGIYHGDGKASIYPASDAGAVQWAKGKRVDVLSLIEAHSPIVTPPVPVPHSKHATLRRPMKGPEVAHWQELIGIKPADGAFGPNTEAATKKWQKAHKLVDDGVVGAKTWGAAE